MKSEMDDISGPSVEKEMVENAAAEDTVTEEIKIQKDLEEELEEAKAEAAENRDMYLRALADLENYRRRVARDLNFHIRSGKKNMILKLITVIDDLERALSAKADYEALHKGIEIITGKFLGILADEGVKPIEALGAPFDPRLHEAVTVCDDEDVDTETVVGEFRRGYIYDDEVIRATMVNVAKPKEN